MSRKKTPLYRVFQQHLPTFERVWTDTEDGGCLPKFVTEELRGFLECGILAHGFAQMHCESCRKRHLVAFSCKGRGFCTRRFGRRCLDRRMTRAQQTWWTMCCPRAFPPAMGAHASTPLALPPRL